MGLNFPFQNFINKTVKYHFTVCHCNAKGKGNIRLFSACPSFVHKYFIDITCTVKLANDHYVDPCRHIGTYIKFKTIKTAIY